MTKKIFIKTNFVLILVSLIFLLIAFGCTPKSVDQPKPSLETTEKEPAVIDEPIIIKAAHDSPDKGPVDLGYIKFKELLEEKTEGKIIVEIYGMGQLSGNDSFVSAGMLQSGDTQIGMLMPGIFSRFDQRFQVFCLPFLYKDLEQAYQSWDGPAGEHMLNLLPEQGIVGLSYFTTGRKVFTNRIRKLETPKDLEGIKFRVPDSPICVETIKALGGIPTATSMGETFVSLQQGVVDGQENAISTTFNWGFHEVQDYLTVTEHEIITFPLCVNKKFFDSLSAEFQEAIISSAKEAAIYERELVNVDDNENLKQMEEAGVQITNLTPEQKKLWMEAVEPVHEKFADVIGEDIIELFYKDTGRLK